jgi:hypothetical protein
MHTASSGDPATGGDRNVSYTKFALTQPIGVVSHSLKNRGTALFLPYLQTIVDLPKFFR